MAMEKFKHPPLPNAPSVYDPQYVRQLVRVIELYFNQLDSLTPNIAQSYTADAFYGGTVTVGTYTTAEKNALTPTAGMLVFDTTLGKLCVYSGSAWQTVTSV
jgi:hypothetical protein